LTRSRVFQSTCSSVGAAQGATPAPVTDQGPGCPAQGNGFAWNLGAVYKQLNAPFGRFGLDTLDADTTALAGNSPGDASYLATDGQLQACASARSALVPQIQTALFDAETGQGPLGGFEASWPGSPRKCLSGRKVVDPSGACCYRSAGR